MERRYDGLRPSPAAETGPPGREVWAFAGYVFDIDGCALTDGSGSSVALTRGELALLRAFVRHPGRVLSRDFLLDTVSGRRAEAFDRSVDVQVGRLRRKIEPDSGQPTLIVTVAGEGYKFVAHPTPVSEVPAPVPTKAEVSASTPTGPPASASARPSRRALIAAAGGGLALLVGGVAWRFGRNDRAGEAAPGVLVLPFENLSGDPARQYLADGVTTDIRTLLSTFPGIRVFAAAAAGPASGWQQLAQRTGARYAVGGGVIRAGDRLRIVAQLYRATDGAALWAERYDVSATNALGPQEDVANRVYDSLAGLRGRIRQDEQNLAWRKAAPDLDEYDFYLRGLALYLGFNRDDVQQARAIWTDGLARFPRSALLRIKLGFTHVWALENYASEHPAADIEAMSRLALEARTLSTGSPLVAWHDHWLMAYVRQWHDWDFAGSVAEARAAAALVPYDPFSRNDLSWLLANAGYFDDAIDWALFGIRHDPNGPPWYYGNLLWGYYLAGRYQEALELVRRRPDLTPAVQVSLYVRLGRMAEARGMVAADLKAYPKDSVVMEGSFPLIEPYRTGLLDDLRQAGMPERS